MIRVYFIQDIKLLYCKNIIRKVLYLQGGEDSPRIWENTFNEVPFFNEHTSRYWVDRSI